MKGIILLFSILICSVSVKAQIENVIVETYYVSDSTDATDTIGGILEAGTKTYRIYIDLKPGSVIKKIYGDSNHALKVLSTSDFFNNKADGQSFGKDFSINRLKENTVALDTWITLGQATRISSKTYFGVIKPRDINGSIIGGLNSDGGSAGIPGGLLTNQDLSAGIPLTTSDGLDTMVFLPTSWADHGFIDAVSGVDSTIFGSIKSGSQFISYNASLQNSGVKGVNTDSNQVLVAQLTTKGEITFELNLEIEELDGTSTKTVKYVANDDTLLPDERVSPFLKYPSDCGCTDPDFLEYSAAYACSIIDSCKTSIVFGCMDSLACNYDPNVNFNIQSLCCYPGYCNDRDISIVCPQLGTGRNRQIEFELYPNPSTGQVTIKSDAGENKEVKYALYNAIGELLTEEKLGIVTGAIIYSIDISGWQDGLFLFRLYIGDKSFSKILLKNSSQE